NLARDAISVKEGRLSGAEPGQSIAFGELVKGAPLVATVSEHTVIESPAAWSVAGASLPKVNGSDFVTGRHRYTSDIPLDDMFPARIVRPAEYNSTLGSVESSAAEKMPSVTVVHDGEFLGVAAPTASAASDAVAAIKAEWTPGAGASGRTLFADLKTRISGGGAPFLAGSIERGLAGADVKID